VLESMNAEANAIIVTFFMFLSFRLVTQRQVVLVSEDPH
jgi:hypothetical protein